MGCGASTGSGIVVVGGAIAADAAGVAVIVTMPISTASHAKGRQQ
ncbi:MAG: hypothetical protein ACRDPM_24135 [Solirubrobacteraceae bacterium]